jgi:hypothetical protein
VPRRPLARRVRPGFDRAQAHDRRYVGGHRPDVRLVRHVDAHAATGGDRCHRTGSLTAPGGSATLTVTASFTAPSMLLTINSPGYEPINYAGTVNGKTMVGTLNGSGFTNVSVTLTRP